jgi:ketosteroid isomerase-like protein
MEEVGMKHRFLEITIITIVGMSALSVSPLLSQTSESACSANPDKFEQVLSDMTTALTAIRRGDPKPYTAKWSTADDVTLFGAWGTIEQGHQRLADTFRWVASRFGPEGESPQDIRTIHRSGDLAVTVGFERGTARVDRGKLREMVIRVTHVYRCEQGDWKLVHRHADFPPVKPKTATEKK